MQNYYQKKLEKLILFIFNELALVVTSSSITISTSSFTLLLTLFIILFTFILFATFFTTSKKQIFEQK